jgi:hypothetical protein
LVGAGSDDGFADFTAGTCGDGVAGFALPPPGDCVPGVIAAEGVVGTEGFGATTTADRRQEADGTWSSWRRINSGYKVTADKTYSPRFLLSMTPAAIQR